MRTAQRDLGKCHECGIPLRRVGTTLADHPGTRTRQRAGQCTSCYNRARRGTTQHPKPSAAPNPVLQAWRIAYEEDRRLRGINPHGTPAPGETPDHH